MLNAMKMYTFYLLSHLLKEKFFVKENLYTYYILKEENQLDFNKKEKKVVERIEKGVVYVCERYLYTY